MGEPAFVQLQDGAGRVLEVSANDPAGAVVELP
jgi:hypothetical protein